MTQPWTHENTMAELGAYALDASTPDERAAIEAHLKTCASCRKFPSPLHVAASCRKSK